MGLKLRQQVEESARKALSDAGLELQWTAAGWEQAHEHAAARSAELKDDSEALKELRFEAFDGHATRKRELAAAQQELVSLKTRKSLLPPSSIENRSAIAAATGVPEEQMPFGGELIDLAEGQEQWRPAAERALRSLATTLLVPGEHFAAVTRYLNDHSVRGALRAVDVSKPLAGGALAVEDVADGDLLTKLDILTTRTRRPDAGEWIRERIALDFAYPCVEDPDELARLDKGLSLGGVVKRNRHTVEKDDRFTGRQDYVLGFDNAAKLELVAAQVEDLQQELAKAAELAQSREESHQGMTRQLEALRRVAEDHRPWEQVSAAVAADELARIEQRLKDALAAQADLEPLRANIEAARHKHQSSTEAAAVLQSEYKALDSQLTAADSLLDAARARLDAGAAVGRHRHGAGTVLRGLRRRHWRCTSWTTSPTRSGPGSSPSCTRPNPAGRPPRSGSPASSRASCASGARRFPRTTAPRSAPPGSSKPATTRSSATACPRRRPSSGSSSTSARTNPSAPCCTCWTRNAAPSPAASCRSTASCPRSTSMRAASWNSTSSRRCPPRAKQFKDAIQNALKVRHTRPGKAAAAASGGRPARKRTTTPSSPTATSRSKRW